jgi:hypothetical protein
MIILAEGLTVSFFSRPDLLLKYIEWYDVEDGVFDCWTDDGTPVLLGVDADKRVHLSYGELQGDAAGLTARLLQYLDRLAPGPHDSLDLPELIAGAIPLSDVNR